MRRSTIAVACVAALALASCGSDKESAATTATDSIPTPALTTETTDTATTETTGTVTTAAPTPKPKPKPKKTVSLVDQTCGGFPGASGKACRTAYEECSIFTVQQMVSEYGGTEDTVAQRYADQTFSGLNVQAGYSGCSIALLHK